MRNLKIGYKWTYLQNRNRLTDLEKIMVTKGDRWECRWGGEDWGFWMECPKTRLWWWLYNCKYNTIHWIIKKKTKPAMSQNIQIIRSLTHRATAGTPTSEDNAAVIWATHMKTNPDWKVVWCRGDRRGSAYLLKWFVGSSRHGAVEMNLTRNHEVEG